MPRGRPRKRKNVDGVDAPQKEDIDGNMNEVEADNCTVDESWRLSKVTDLELCIRNKCTRNQSLQTPILLTQ